MHATGLDGGFADPARDAARAFREVLEATARPGRVRRLAGAEPPQPMPVSAGIVLLTLVDRTTPLHLTASWDTPAVRDWLTFHTGAPLVAPASAVFAAGPWAEVTAPADYPIGTSEYPDRSTTLVAGVPALGGTTHRLIGPGIETDARLGLPGMQVFQANRGRFPLGLDVILCADDRIVAIPRTTRIEEAG
jgi:alpha-D-ribose 1-methylphosphonate 5-triphosphate synthase subunit PhnH